MRTEQTLLRQRKTQTMTERLMMTTTTTTSSNDAVQCGHTKDRGRKETHTPMQTYTVKKKSRKRERWQSGPPILSVARAEKKASFSRSDDNCLLTFFFHTPRCVCVSRRLFLLFLLCLSTIYPCVCTFFAVPVSMFFCDVCACGSCARGSRNALAMTCLTNPPSTRSLSRQKLKESMRSYSFKIER